MYRWTWIWRTTVRRIFAYDGRYAWSKADAYQVFVICIWRILHMTDQFSWSHWVSHIQVKLYHGFSHFLTLPMLKLLSSNAQECKYIWKLSKPCNVGIHWIALTEYSQMSTHMSGFQWFFRIYELFCIGQLATSSIRVKVFCIIL